MLTRAARRKPLATTAMMVILMAGFAMPAHAGKWSQRQAKLSRCGGNRSLAKIDMKTCPANKRRNAIVLHRACCENPNGRVICKPFTPCPPNSPS